MSLSKLFLPPKPFLTFSLLNWIRHLPRTSHTDLVPQLVFRPPQVMGPVTLVIIVVFRSVVCGTARVGLLCVPESDRRVQPATSSVSRLLARLSSSCRSTAALLALASRSWTTTTRSGLCTAVHR